MQSLGYLISKKKIGKLLFLLPVIFVIGFLLVVFVANNGNNKKQGQLLASYKQIPLEGEFVQQELIVQFHEGYSPDELKEAIKKKQNSSFILKPFVHITTVANGLLGGLDSQETLIKIDNELKAVGVASYNRLVEDNSSSSVKRYYKLSFNPDIDLKLAQRKLSQLYYIASTEPNRIFHLDRVPNDPSYSQLWGIQKIQAPQAWDTTIGSQGITVAVIDSGIDASHPEFAGRILPGHDYVNNDSDPEDDLGHGTHVAGTIGAIGDNGVGVVGVNWDVKILPLRICKKNNIPPAFNECNLSAALPGIQFAINNNARVINMSLGGGGQCGFTLQNMINNGINAGITFAIAAGNSSKDASGQSPANCNGVITVGANDQFDRRSVWSATGASNYGSLVEISAPGTGIISTWLGGGYKPLDGTSMATPYVAGAAALLLSANPSLSPQEVSDCLVQNADPISTDQLIGPRLNIFKAIQNCGGNIPTQPVTTGIPTLTPSVTPNPTVTNAPSKYSISINFWSDNNNNRQKDAPPDTPFLGTVNSIELLNSSGSTIANGTTSSGSYTFSNVSPGAYRLRIRITGYSTYTTPLISITNNDSSFDLLIPPTKSIPPVIVTQVPTSTPTPTPTPTQTPIASTPTKKPTPTPTRIPTYSCDIDDQNCPQGQKNLQLCPLICTPN